MPPLEFASVFVVSHFALKEKFRPVCHTMETSNEPRFFFFMIISVKQSSRLLITQRDIVSRVILIKSAKLYHVSHKWKSYVLCWLFTVCMLYGRLRGRKSFRITLLIKSSHSRKSALLSTSLWIVQCRCRDTPFASFAHSIRRWRYLELNLRLSVHLSGDLAISLALGPSFDVALCQSSFLSSDAPRILRFAHFSSLRRHRSKSFSDVIRTDWEFYLVFRANVFRRDLLNFQFERL